LKPIARSAGSGKRPNRGGTVKKKPSPPRHIFVIQKHKTKRLHYDLRLEAGGVLKSWAVPKGPSTDPASRCLAARTEDYPIEYADFEGIIPEGEYGAGSVLIWDKGTYENLTSSHAHRANKGKEIPIEKGIAEGHISFRLNGKRLKGAFALTRIRRDEWGKEDWILVKIREETKKARVNEKTLKDAMERLKQAPQPKWVKPMLATLMDKKKIPGAGWFFEPKLDGERCLAFKKNGRVALYSRNRLNINGNYPELVEAMESQGADNFIADGEIVAPDEKGIPSFLRIQPRMQIRSPIEARATGIEVFFYLFDLLYFDGYDLTRLALIHRKGMLRQIFSFSGHLRYLEHETGGGKKYYEDMCRKGYEGILAKRAESRYIQARTKDWLKFRCMNEQEFIICGYTDPGGSRTGFGALLIGYYEKGKGPTGPLRLLYAGKVGTGYDEFTLSTLSREFKKLVQETPPYDDYPANKLIPRARVHWLRPELVCDVEFTEWTPDGLLRHPSFKGLRRDKKPAEVTRERPA
jgi:bifunctional non-homologous end joining protein LigD